MEKLIKTILGKDEEYYMRYLEQLLSTERKEILSDQEKIMLEYLRDTYEEARKYPSENYFLDKFPEYSVPLDNAKELEKHDLEIHFTKMVSDRSKKLIGRKIMQVASNISSEGFTDEINEEIRKVYMLNREVDLDDAVMNIGKIKEIYERKKNQPTGLLTFVDELDDKIGGLSKGTVNIIFGYTGHFKSTFALNIAYNNVYDLGYNVVVISLELPKEHIMYNVLSRHSFRNKFTKYPYISHSRMKKYSLDDNEEQFVFEDVLTDFEDEKEGDLVILDETDFKNFTFSDIRKRLETVDDKLDGGIDAIIWDHANLFKFSGEQGRMSQYDIINEYVSFIRELSIQWLKDEETGDYRQLTNIILAQANRQGYKKANRKGEGRYDLTAIAEANELERAAYRIFSIYTNENLKQSKEAKVQILKNRSGPTLYDPTSIFADPVPYVVGESVEGFSETIAESDFDSVFDSGDLGI